MRRIRGQSTLLLQWKSLVNKAACFIPEAKSNVTPMGLIAAGLFCCNSVMPSALIILLIPVNYNKKAARPISPAATIKGSLPFNC